MQTPRPSILSEIAPYALTALAVGAPILLKHEGISDSVQLSVVTVIGLMAGGHVTAQVIAKHKAGR